MPVAPVFSCEFCRRRPDPQTHANLRRQLLDLRRGEYVDAEPDGWAGRRGTHRARRLARAGGATFGR